MKRAVVMGSVKARGWREDGTTAATRLGKWLGEGYGEDLRRDTRRDTDTKDTKRKETIHIWKAQGTLQHFLQRWLILCTLSTVSAGYDCLHWKERWAYRKHKVVDGRRISWSLCSCPGIN